LATFHKKGLPRAFFVHVSNLERRFPKIHTYYSFHPFQRDPSFRRLSRVADITNTDPVFLFVVRLRTNHSRETASWEKKQGKTVTCGSVPPSTTARSTERRLLSENDSVNRERQEKSKAQRFQQIHQLSGNKCLPPYTSDFHPHHCVASQTTRSSTNCQKSGYKPLTGQLVCPDHPMQKPHLREGVMFPSVSISSLSRPESKTALPPRGMKTASVATW